MSDYRFSVLMAVYNKESPEFFAAALKSNLVDQRLLPDEMVLVCDGPLTDDLEAVISEYKERFPDILKVHRLSENDGLGKALNFGLIHCKYEWVARSDSDDICAEDRFIIQMEFLKNHPEVDILSSYIDEFDTSWDQPKQKKKLPLQHSEIVRMATFRNPINHMAVIFKKSIVLAAGSYQPLPYTEDYYLWIRAIDNGATFANVDQYLVHARVGNGMVQRRGKKEYITSWKTLNDCMRDRHMINSLTYCKNMIAVRVFVYMPVKLRALVYKCILR